MSFKSSALFLYLLCLKCWGLDLLVRSYRRIHVGASRGPDLGRDNLRVSRKLNQIKEIVHVRTSRHQDVKERIQSELGTIAHPEI